MRADFVKNLGRHPLWEDYTLEMDVDIDLCLNAPLYLREGLIKTYPIEQTVDSLSRYLNLGKCDSEKDCINFVSNLDDDSVFPSGAIAITYGKNNCDCITVAVENNERNIDIVTKRLETCGYFKSYDKIIGIWDIIRFEKKFDKLLTDFVKKKIFVYHICPFSLKNKILSQGLVPKDSKWPGYENEGRIYLFLSEFNQDKLDKTVEHFKIHKPLNNYYIYLRINTLYMNKDSHFYVDPRMDNAIYTMDNIPPNAIEIIGKSSGLE